MKRKEQEIIAELGLREMRRVTPIKHPKVRLVLTSSRKDQEEVNDVAEVLVKKTASKQRINKRKRNKKRRNKEFVRAYIACLAENAIVIAPNEPANPDDVPKAAAGATGDVMEDNDD